MAFWIFGESIAEYQVRVRIGFGFGLGLRGGFQIEIRKREWVYSFDICV